MVPTTRANHRLALEMLIEISNDRDVIEVTGEYTGGVGGWGASHEHKDHTYIQNYYNYSSSSSTSLISLQQQVNKEQEQTQSQKNHRQITGDKNGV